MSGELFKEVLLVDPPEGSAERVWRQIREGLDDNSQTRRGGRRTPWVAVAIAAVIALLLALSVATVVRSGDEPVQISGLERLANAEAALDEADKAAGRGEFGTAEELMGKYASEMEAVEVEAEGNEEVAEILDQAIERHMVKLKEVEAKVPEVARKRGIARAQEVHARNAARKAARIQEGRGPKGRPEGSEGKPPEGKGRDAGKANRGKDRGDSRPLEPSPGTGRFGPAN